MGNNFDGVANNIIGFIEAISDEADFTDGSGNFETYFDDYEFYFTCRSGPLDPQMGAFPVNETWAWVRQPNEFPGEPLEWTADPLQIIGDFSEAPVGPNPDDAVQSLYYGVFPSPNPNDAPGLWAHYTEYTCRKLEDEGYLLAVRHGWSSIVDSSRNVQPFNVAMPALP